MSLSLELDGTRKLSKQLQKAAKQLDVDMTEAQMKSAKLVVDQARNITPVRTGNLRDSLRYSAIGQMYSNLPYAGPIHWGWPARNIAENMFLLNAARFLEPQWIRYFQEAVEDAIREAAK